MKALLWGLTAVLALMWTGLAWASAELVQWTVGLLASGQAAELGKTAVEFQVPAWMAPFIDTALVGLLQNFVQWLMSMASGGAPLAGSVISWLVPLVWIVWAFGLVLLLVLAGVLHLLIRKLPAAGRPVAA